MAEDFEQKNLQEGDSEERKIKKVSSRELKEHFGEDAWSPRGKNKSGEISKNKSSLEEEAEIAPPLDLERVLFTDHALDKLAQRFRELNEKELENPKSKALELLSRAKEEDAIDPALKVIRLINNKLEPSRYFVRKGWRFVIVEQGDKYIVKTIERRERG